MAFNITQCGPVFRIVVGSQIMVPPTESDSKICIDAINGSFIASPRRIQVLCSDTTKLAALCQSIQFKWGDKSSCSCFDFLVS